MSPLYWEVVAFIGTLLLAGLFAFLETAFTALRLFKLKELESNVAKYKTLLECWEKNPQRILITILIANNFAHVLCSVLISEIMQTLIPNSFGLAIGVALATVMILIFGDILPKTVAKTHNEFFFKNTLWIINLLVKLFYPVVTVLQKGSDTFFRLCGGMHTSKQEAVSEEEIEFLIDYSEEKGVMETEKTEMLQNVFGLGQSTVSKLMIPQPDMVAINVESSLDYAIEILIKYRFSRLPVYEGKEDNIIGIIYQKDVFDLLSRQQQKPLRELVRPILFVPETKKSNQLLSEFLKKRMHMAIVIDEYGSVVGLVTLEDVIEEIVGEIADEHEKIHTGIVLLEQGGWLIDAGISLEEIEDLLDIKFNVQDSITLAGFLAEKLQHLPKKGERLFYEGYCFQIQQASSKRVFQVLVFEDKGEEPRVVSHEQTLP